MVADAVRIIDNYIKVSLLHCSGAKILSKTLSPVTDTSTLPHQSKVLCLWGRLCCSSSALFGFTQRAMHVS